MANFKLNFTDAEGQVRVWAHIFCFVLAVLLNFILIFVFFKEPISLQIMPKIISMIFFIAIGLSVVFLPIQYVLRQTLFKYHLLARLPYIVLPLFVYLIIIFLSMLYMQQTRVVNDLSFMFSKESKTSMHLPIIFYIIISSILNKYKSPTPPRRKKSTLPDILDDL